MTLFEAKQKVRENKNLDIVLRQLGPYQYFGVIPKGADINDPTNIEYKY